MICEVNSVILNVIDIQKEIGAGQNFSGEISPDDIEWQGELIEFKSPIHMDGEIINAGDILLLNCNVSCILGLICGSCTKNFDYSLNFTFEARLSKNTENDDPDMFKYTGYEIDISDIVLQFIILEIPSKRQCKDNCKGLCPICGTNLNDHMCECSKNMKNSPNGKVDERFAVLKNLLPDLDEEV